MRNRKLPDSVKSEAHKNTEKKYQLFEDLLTRLQTDYIYRCRACTDSCTFDGKWYKADYMGHEGLAEVLVSHLLQKSTASLPVTVLH